jgi:NAD+ synthase
MYLCSRKGEQIVANGRNVYFFDPWSKMCMMNFDCSLSQLTSSMRIEPEPLSQHLENFIKEYVDKLERDGVILGLSGGIDSAVVAALCARAVGAGNTLALIMPDRDSKKEHVKDALDFARSMGIETKLIDITPHLSQLGTYELFILEGLPIGGESRETIIKRAYDLYRMVRGDTPFSASIVGFRDKEFGPYLGRANAYYRVKHRLRMVLLYLHAELENRLVVGAANKTEYRIGFFVKHGCDDAADIMPIIGLYKTQVRELARFLGIPSRIIDKAPSPDVIPGIVDEDAIGVPYEELDLILLALEKGWGSDTIAAVLNVERGKVEYVRNLVQRSEHMRHLYTPR